MAKQAKHTETKAAESENQFAALLENYFGLKEQGTDIRTEFIAGLTTFLTMVYIVFVNPAILSKAGMDQGAVFVATCIAAAVSTMVMALYANYPIALAPGMGINAFFAFTVVLAYKYTWQQALAARVLLGRAVLSDFGVPHPAIRDRIRSRKTSSSPHRPASGCSSASSRWRKPMSWWRIRRHWSRSAI